MTEVLTQIPLDLTPEKVLRRLMMGRSNETIEASVKDLLEQVRGIMNPGAAYRIAYIEDRSDDSVTIDGVVFTSRVLRKNLEGIGRVFPFIATCGRKLDAFRPESGDVMESFILDTIRESAMRMASSYLREHILLKYAPGQLSSMSPGSLPEWPITQQRELFRLFPDAEETLGVKLLPSCLMSPVKSVSGILFPTEIRFESCQLCPREVCQGRRAPYSPEMSKDYGLEAV